MRDEHALGLLLLDERRERQHMTVRRVASQRGVIDDDHFVHGRRGQFGRRRVDAGAEDRDLDRPAGLLRRRDGFPRRAIQRAVALFCYNQYHPVVLLWPSQLTASITMVTKTR